LLLVGPLVCVCRGCKRSMAAGSGSVGDGGDVVAVVSWMVVGKKHC
jgi:hypothetical protein